MYFKPDGRIESHTKEKIKKKIYNLSMNRKAIWLVSEFTEKTFCRSAFTAIWTISHHDN